MNYIEISEAEKLVRSIRDCSNPAAACEALALRNKWLLENDLGTLHMTTAVRRLLDMALASPDDNS